MKRVLIIKMWALGDILMATPLLSALRRKYPEVHITWVVDESHGELLTNHPSIDELVVLHSGEWRRMMRQGNLWAWLKRSQEIRHDMAQRHFDLAINCHPDKWWTVILCAAPIRVGLYPTFALPKTRRFYTHPVNRPSGIHNTDHYLLALEALGIPAEDKQMTIGETPDEKPFFAKFVHENRLSTEKPILVFSPFSTGDNRNWEPERYAAVAKQLIEGQQAQIILTCAPRDREKIATITAHCPHQLVLAEGTTLRQYIALLRYADRVLCVDSSAMHLAAALHTPYVALFGATPVAERAPLAGQGLPIVQIDQLACAPCDRSTCTHSVYRACMKQIEVSEVVAALEEVGKTTDKK